MGNRLDFGRRRWWCLFVPAALGLGFAVSIAAHSVAHARLGLLTLEAIGLVLLGVVVATFVRWCVGPLPLRSARYGVILVFSLFAVCGAILFFVSRGGEGALLLQVVGLSASLSLLTFPGVRERHQGVQFSRSRCSVSGPTPRVAGRHGRAQLAILRALANAVSTRDGATQEHAQRVARLASRLAGILGVPPSDAESVYWAAMLHDIGKVAIPRSVLRRPGSLSPEEFQAVKDHSQAGADILRSCHPGLADIAQLVLHHHERWDGRGYPSGFRAQAIPLGARLIAVVDTFEALTSDRPYRRALSVHDALDTICAGAGSHFDPDIVIIFERMIREAPLPAYAWPLLAGRVGAHTDLGQSVLAGAGSRALA